MSETNPQRIVDPHMHWFDVTNPYKHAHKHQYTD